jgi:hypothetical protein
MDDDYYTDVYSSPGRYGLKIVGSVSFDNEPYQFHVGVVWQQEETGLFFIGTDSGCSCPSPFESVHSLDKLSGPYRKNGAIQIVSEWSADDDYSDDQSHRNEWFGAQKVELISKITQA